MQMRVGGFSRLVIGAAMVLAAPLAVAQYKCQVNGKTIYADAPCAPNAKHVGALEDRLTEEQKMERRQVTSRERNQLGEIKTDTEVDRRQHSRMAEQVAAQDRMVAGIKASRCASAQRDLQSAKRSVAIFQDVGMQRSLNQRRAEQDAAERRVRDECN